MGLPDLLARKRPTSDARLIRGTFILTLLLLALLGLLLWSNEQAEKANVAARQGETHILDILAANDGVLRAAQDAETGQRGYLLTGQKEFLEPYVQGRQEWRASLERLKSLAQQNGAIQEQISRIEKLSQTRLDEIGRSIALRQAGRFSETSVVDYLRTGKHTMDGLRQALSEVEREERLMLARQHVKARTADEQAVQWRAWLSYFTVAVSLFSIFAIYSTLKAQRVSRDNRELEASTAQLREGRRLLQAIIDSSTDAIFVKDRDGRVIFGNALLKEIVARPLSELKGIPLLPTDDPEEARQMLAADRTVMTQGIPQSIDETIIFKGQRRHFVTEKMPWRRNGEVVGMIGIARDVTDRRQREALLEERVGERTAQLRSALDSLQHEMAEREHAEAALRQMQKLESLGQLTGGIAHDFNNMLSIIMGALAMARRRLPSSYDPELGTAIDNAEDGAKRAAELTGRLLAFSRQQPLVPRPVEVNALLSETIRLLSRTLGPSINLELDIDDDAGWIAADPPQLENALVNLALNARDAMPDGGTLTLSSRREGDEVIMMIGDSGCGMTAAVCERVFEPFFTTKPPGKGTGLGLSQVHGFIVQSGGTISVDSIPGDGTRVTLRFPRIEEPGTTIPPAKTHAGTANGETILLVEDEPLVRLATEEELVILGYSVLSAASGEAALSLIEAHPEIQLILTDVSMAEMDGRTLAHEAQARRPGLKVLLMSGHDPGLGSEVDLPLLPKPYSTTELASAVAKALGND